MDNLRKSLIEELMLTLKIPQGSFNFGTIADEIKHIENRNLREFYKLVMTSDSFGNGMKAIIQTAERFKPDETHEAKTKAEQLIKGVETMNTVLWNEAKELKRIFEDYVEMYEFDNVCDETKAILNNVAPYYDIAQLTINIRKYQTSVDTINAFKRAIENTNVSDAVQIANPLERLRIKK